MTARSLPIRAATVPIAGALLIVAPARADDPALHVATGAEELKQPPRKRDDASVNQLRIDVGGAYFRGTKKLGHGTRAPYQGGAGTGRFDARWFPWRYVGFEATGWYSFTHVSAEPGAGLQAAFDVAPIRWSGAWGGGLVIAGGAGIEFGERSWMGKEVRGYPLIGARLVLWPTKQTSLRAAWDFEPVTTTELRVRAHRIEVAVGHRFLQSGVRAGFSQATGGDPVRTYGELRFGAFFGAAFY